MEHYNEFSYCLFSSFCVQIPSLTSLLFSNLFRDSFLGNFNFLCMQPLNIYIRMAILEKSLKIIVLQVRIMKCEISLPSILCICQSVSEKDGILLNEDF